MSFRTTIKPASKPRSKHIAVDTFDPIATINTTPLIDVMLVLLIMMIITIPVSTHKVPIELPSPTAARVEPAPVHLLAIDSSGRVSWDGAPLSDRQLRRRLTALANDAAPSDLHVAAHAEARYDRVDGILAEVNRAGITRLGFVGHEAFADDLD